MFKEEKDIIYLDDDSLNIDTDDIDEYIFKTLSKYEIISLPNDLKYSKLIERMHVYIHPVHEENLYNTRFNFNYETIRMLINQSKELNISIFDTIEEKIRFILLCTDESVQEKLFYDEGFDKDKSLLINVKDPRLFFRFRKRFSSELSMNDFFWERRQYIEHCITEDDIILKNISNILFDQDYYFEAKRVEYLNASEGFKKYLLDLIAEYFFDDVYDTVCMDIEQILKYNFLKGNNLIDSFYAEYYNDFLNIKNQSDNTLVPHVLHFLNKYKNLDLREVFYDTITKLKSESHKELVEGCTSFTKDSTLYNKTLSDLYGCDVYYLDGQEFYGFVRADARIEKYKKVSENGELKLIDNRQPTIEEINRLSSSFTYIGTENIQTYKNPYYNLTMLYGNIDPQYISHVYHNDSWSSEIDTRVVNELHTPSSLLKETQQYPEIIIENLNGIKPIGLVCIGQITSWDVEFSKNNNIPIVLINEEKYERKNFHKISFREYEYDVINRESSRRR